MGQVTRLAEAIERLTEFGRDDIIYAAEPWTENSLAVIILEEADEPVFFLADGTGFKYFLEVGIATDFVEDWAACLDEEPSLTQICDRIIRYAIDDA